MSLKAKLEAVIYAAEEPVTLAQFASLFAEDALAWKAEREAELALALESEQALDSSAGVEDAVGPVDSTLELVDLLAVVESESEPEVPEDKVPDAEAAPAEPVEEIEVIDPELEAKRADRKRDREVREILRGILDELIADYAQENRGIEIREIAGGFRMGTKPEIHDAVRIFVKSLKPPLKLSLPALETLAVIAYKQPVTAPEVGEIRGVDSAGVLGSLMSRKLIATAGRKQVIGRPMQYKTTKEFLLRFGLKDVTELPSMEEFEKMAALELSEESLDEESSESQQPVEQSGDLFTGAEQNLADHAESTTGTEEPESQAPVSDKVSETISIPTAEPSKEAAEAHDALVERQNAEEVEVE